MLRHISFLFIIFVLLLNTPLATAEKTISLKLSDLGKWMNRYSPELKLAGVETRLSEISEYLDAGLQFTNPEFSYKNESLKEGSLHETEQEFEVSKSFQMPWIYAARKAGWKYLKESIQLSSREFKNELLAGMRSGYIELVLMGKNVNEYKNTGKILKSLLDTINRKEKEGFISPVNLRMISVAVANMDIQTMKMEFDLSTKEKKWKQAAGIDPEEKVKLITDIRYIPARLLTLEKILALYRSSPGYKKWEFSKKGHQEKVRAEKTGLIPGITLGAGFKKVSDGPKGPTLGISFGIPLFNRNSIQIKRAELEEDIHNSRMAWEVKSGYNEITTWFGIVKKYSGFLNGINVPSVSPSTEIHPLLEAFKEGTIGVTDLIGGIQLFLEGMENYHSALTHYYAHIFKIESRTEAKLVTFN